MTRKIFIAIIFTLLITSCSKNENRNSTYDGNFLIDAVFEKFYGEHGGESILGPAISPSFIEDDVIYQYTTTCLMMYLKKTREIKLAALGTELVVRESPVKCVADGNDLCRNGHNISPNLLKLINSLGGLDIVGLPLTEFRYNQKNMRYEQYFENLGFYQVANDNSSSVHLLAFGAWRCGDSCLVAPPLNSRIDAPIKKLKPVVALINSVGIEFTGFALTEPYLSPDGNLEQVFENVILFINPDHPDRVILRDLPKLVGYQSDPLESPREDAKFFFYPVEGEMGFNIPVEFLEYIKARGGFKISGAPMTRLQMPTGSNLIQCFEAICLNSIQEESGVWIIKPLPLGYIYRDKKTVVSDNHDAMIDDGKLEKEISILLWESYPMISQDLSQEIRAAVTLGSAPFSGVQPTLIILLPNEIERVYTMPPTDPNGESMIKLEPLDVESGTLIPYQVCINYSKTKRFCVKDSYLVWDVVKIEEDHNTRFAPVDQLIRYLQEQIKELLN